PFAEVSFHRMEWCDEQSHRPQPCPSAIAFHPSSLRDMSLEAHRSSNRRHKPPALRQLALPLRWLQGSLAIPFLSYQSPSARSPCRPLAQISSVLRTDNPPARTPSDSTRGAPARILRSRPKACHLAPLRAKSHPPCGLDRSQQEPEAVVASDLAPRRPFVAS